MVGYVYWKNNFKINGKIENVTSVENNKIIGEGEVVVFGEGSDFIILENDVINKNKDDVIEIDNLDDSRDYFLKSKEEWFREKQANLERKMQEQQDQMDRLLQLLEGKEE